MPITRNFTLYLNAGISVAPTVHVNQYDRGEQWVFTLLDDKGQKYTPSSGALIGVKADGNAIAGVTGTVGSNGDVYITETQQMTAAAGKAIFELTIDGQTHGTANFIVQVEKKPTDDAVLSESDLSIIQQGIDSVTPAAINETVSEYLAEHMTNPPIDPTLTVSNAAADAKVTGDNITDLKNALSNIAEMMPVDVDTEFEQGYRHLQTGCALKSSNAWCTSTVPISLIKGTTVSIESGYKYQLIDPAPENNGAVLASQTAEQYTATSDVIAYIEVKNNAGTALTPNQAQSVITVSKTPAIVTMVNASANILSDISVRSKNLFDKNNIVNGEFVRSSDGAFVANTNFWHSEFIPVTGGETYTLRYVNQVAFYSASSTSAFISGVGGYSTDTAAISSTFVAPNDAKCIVICGHNTQLDSDQLEIGDSFTGYAEYGYVVKQPSGQGYTRISDIMSKIIFANNPVKIKLIGDSTTAGQGGTGYTNDASHGELILTDAGYGSYYTNPNGYCWANLLKSYFEEHFNCTVTNYGCSGMRVHRMVLYLDTLITEDDDIVIFMGGLNDRNDNSAHTTLQNLASDIQAIIDYCHSHGKSIIIMSPIPTLDNETGTKNFKTDDIDHVYMYAANMNGMEYISVFRRMNSYCLTSGVSLADLLNADSLHPNDSGYNIMFDIICDGLNIGIYPVK